MIASVRIGGFRLRLESDGDITTESRGADPFTIATAMPKGDRLDWLVQKVTEPGVDRIVLLQAERSVVRWKADRGSTNCRSCSASPTRHVDRAVGCGVSLTDPEASNVLADLAQPGGRRLGPNDRSVAIGPEGGWTSGELEQAGDRVTVSGNPLGTETAAVTTAALCVTFER